MLILFETEPSLPISLLAIVLILLQILTWEFTTIHHFGYCALQSKPLINHGLIPYSLDKGVTNKYGY